MSKEHAISVQSSRYLQSFPLGFAVIDNEKLSAGHDEAALSEKIISPLRHSPADGFRTFRRSLRDEPNGGALRNEAYELTSRLVLKRDLLGKCHELGGLLD
jgi:hypothetical protein